MEYTFFIALLGVIALTIQSFLFKIKEPAAHYAKMLAAILLLLLVWIGNEENPFGPKLILTSFAFSILWKEYFSLKKANEGL